YPGLAVTQLRALGVPDSLESVSHKLADHLQQALR
ncbi:MAG: hypothetical protein QOK44_4108, partial [Betaproteobacteria bacterium]|nr:hypothetical protein [Betaproteobacteria bacterium]